MGECEKVVRGGEEDFEDSKARLYRVSGIYEARKSAGLLEHVLVPISVFPLVVIGQF
jgi:hypothetical protein